MSLFTAVTPSRRSPPGAPPGAAPDSLDLRIQRAEQRLMAREQRVHRHVDGLALRLRPWLQPRRLWMPLAGAAAVAASVWWWRRRRRMPGPTALARKQAAGQSAGAGGASQAGLGGGWPWLRWLGLAWPLLPRRVTHGVSPALASTALSAGLPLARWLMSRRRVLPP